MPASHLEAHLGYWLRFVSNHVSHAFQRKLEAEGVTVSEWVVLSELHRQTQISPGDLVEQTGLTKGAISKLSARLEAARLVERSVDSADRRNHILKLTRAGRELVPRLADLADRNDAYFFGHLPHEQRQFLREAMQGLVAYHKLKEVPVK